MKILKTALILVFTTATVAFANEQDRTTSSATTTTTTTTTDLPDNTTVQEKRSLKKKYKTRKDSVATPTSPSNKRESDAKKAAVEDTDDTNRDSLNE